MPRSKPGSWGARWLGIASLGLAAATASAACGGSGPEAASPDAAAAAPAKAKDAPAIAQAMIGGRVSALVFVDRVRDKPIAPQLLALGPVREVLEGSELEPMRDLDRVFVTGPSAAQQRAVVFAEHNLPRDRIPDLVSEMVRKSDPKGQVLEAAPNWKVRVERRGRVGVVAFYEPNFVVVVPPDLADKLDAFAATGGLPGPTGEEAAKFVVAEPSTSLRARGVPRIPESISALGGDVFLPRDGRVEVAVVGQSTAEQAQSDAQTLTRAVDDATSLDLGIVKMRAFRPVVFAAAGDRVATRLELSQGEVSQLLSLAQSFIR